MIKRMLAVIISIVIMFLTALGKLCFLMLSPPEVAASQYGGKTITITVPRGTIYDCNMTPLTNSQTRTVAVVTPTAAAAAAVTEQLGANASSALAKLRSGGPVLLEVPASFECDDAVKYTVDVRYAANQTCAHIIGYLDSSGNGVTGIESAYNDLLGSQQPLSVTYRVDALGRALTGVEPELSGSAKATSGVVLTIDARLQRLAQAAAESRIEKGAALIMESATGKILASVSLPDYSPLDVGAALESNDSSLVNRALSAYNVGSVFKLCVAASALKSGISAFRTDNCTGNTLIGDNTFNCHLHTGHDRLDMTQALAKSCNVYFIGLGQTVGANALYDMCVRFGFNRAYSLAPGLNADAGTLPSTATLRTQPAALANFSFGQGELMLTPLHIATMVSSIANGGMLVTPSVVSATVEDGKSTPIPLIEPRRVLSKTDASVLRQMMLEVVESGTGTAAKPESSSAGGKTATAETGWKVDGRLITQAWFAGFYPENGKYTIVVVREDGTSGAADCAPVFKQIADSMAKLGF